MKNNTFAAVLLFTFAFILTADAAETVKNQKSLVEQAREKDEIMRRDQIDPTNTLAIPFDDSEIEDEEEINRDEKKELFPLPHSK